MTNICGCARDEGVNEISAMAAADRLPFPVFPAVKLYVPAPTKSMYTACRELPKYEVPALGVVELNVLAL